MRRERRDDARNRNRTCSPLFAAANRSAAWAELVNPIGSTRTTRCVSANFWIVVPGLPGLRRICGSMLELRKCGIQRQTAVLNIRSTSDSNELSGNASLLFRPPAKNNCCWIHPPTSTYPPLRLSRIPPWPSSSLSFFYPNCPPFLLGYSLFSPSFWVALPLAVIIEWCRMTAKRCGIVNIIHVWRVWLCWIFFLNDHQNCIGFFYAFAGCYDVVFF